VADYTIVMSTLTKPKTAAAVAAAVVVAEAVVVDKSANAVGSCCAAKVCDEEMGRHVDCAG